MTANDIDASKALEDNLMPSLWTKRMDPALVVGAHVKFTTEESKRVAQTIPADFKIPYGPSARATLDVFGTDLPRDSPILAYISGGYWQELSGDISAYPVAPLHEHGVVCVIPDYSRAPGVSMSDIVTEMVSFGKWLLNFAQARKSRSIILAGHSAGGHLCGVLLSSPWFASLDPEERSLFRAVFHLASCFDLGDIPKTSINDPLHLTTDEVRKFSPLEDSNLKRALENCENLHTYVIVGQNEAPSLIKQGQSYFQAMQSAGQSKVKWTQVPDVDHFDLVEKLASADYWLTQEIVKVAQDL